MTQELKNILYVEDEADIQAVARLALEAVGGFSVTICSSGAEAVKRAPELRPDLILLDVMMPGMDGGNTLCIAPGSLDTSLSHAAGLSDIAVCHA